MVCCAIATFLKGVYMVARVSRHRIFAILRSPTHNFGEAEQLIYKPEVVRVFHCFMVGSLWLTWNY